jgi:hypothetical protein
VHTDILRGASQTEAIDRLLADKVDTVNGQQALATSAEDHPDLRGAQRSVHDDRAGDGSATKKALTAGFYSKRDRVRRSCDKRN